jgi:hypothetical protein
MTISNFYEAKISNWSILDQKQELTFSETRKNNNITSQPRIINPKKSIRSKS